MSDPRLKSPLLVGQTTNSPLDLVTSRLLFIWPLTDSQVKWLNTVIYQDSLFYINYWSLTHTFFGMIWGLFMLRWPKIFTIGQYILLHTIFEIWEAWAGGYFSGRFKMTLNELVDGLMDTLFGLAGVILIAYHDLFYG